MRPTKQHSPLSLTLSNLIVGAFLLFWLIPVLYYGVCNSPAPWVPKILQARTNVSRLFSSEANIWATYQIEFRKSGSYVFEALDEERHFKMKPFGHNTRFTRAVALGDDVQRLHLCKWIGDQLQHSLHKDIAEVRIISVRTSIGKNPGGEDANAAERQVVVSLPFEKP